MKILKHCENPGNSHNFRALPKAEPFFFLSFFSCFGQIVFTIILSCAVPVFISRSAGYQNLL